MYRIRLPFAAIVCLSLAAVLQAGEKSPSKQASDSGKPHAPVSYLKTPLSFVPNVGQSSSVARFLAQGPGYTVELEPRGARLSFAGASGAQSRSVTMDLLNARHDADMRGEDLLPGKYNYFPTSDPKTWFSNVPSYSKVRYATAYPGVDVAFYGNANRLEYDFLLQPGARADQIRMGLGGLDGVTVNSAGDLVLRTSAGDLSLLKPVAYQTSSDGKRQIVKADYRLERAAAGESAMVSLALGSYDHHRALVIDPVFALNYSEYLSSPYVGSVAADNSGHSFVTGNNNGTGLYVTEFNSSGAVVYNTTIGAGAAYPTKIAIDGTGRAYVVGRIDGGATLPTASNSYKSSVTASQNGFYVQVSSTGASVPYATFLGGTDTGTSAAYGLGVDSSGNSYLGGYTYSGTFPVTSGVYQSTFSGTPGSNYNGWVAKINPAASGNASLVYSTYLGTASAQVLAVGVDSSGNAYAASLANASTFPVTAGAFHYDGYDSSSGGAYVTKLNTGATALVYSAYLGYGTPYSIAVEGQSSPSAYVTGYVQYADFPTTPGAYQTSYAGGFVTKMSADGSSEVYSTFLGGPSSYAGGYSGANTVVPWSIALPNGCASSCNAYISGRTNTNDFPVVNPIQNFNPSPGGNVAFIVELAANGNSALFSTYLSGFTQGFWNGFDDSPYYGFTPAISVDSSGNISMVGDLGGSPQDFPVTTSIPSNTQNTAVLVKIEPSASPYAWATPTTINFGSQPIGVSTSIYNGSNIANTVHLRNMSATPMTISSIVVSSSIFSESDDCSGAIAAGSYCTLTLNFTPAALGARTGTVTVTSNASDSPTVITLTGSGYDTAFEQISPQSLSFGNQAVGTSSAPQTITVTNLGDQSWAPNIYSNSPSFTETNNCPSEVAPGASCVISVTFTPTQVGLISSSIGVYGATGQFAVGVSGTGTTGTAGTLAFSAAALQFGTELVGTTTAYQGVTIQNTSSVPVTITSLVTAGDFALYSTSCTLPGQLNPQTSCIAYVTFTPTAAGTRTGTLTITDSASGSPQTVALTGTGIAAVQTLEFYPGTTVVFPDQPVGFPSGTMTIYAENTGTSPITIDRVLVSGDFQLTSAGCAATVLQGNLDDGAASYSYCSVNVTFTPTAAGFRTGTLTFIDSEGTQTVNLSGNGITDTGVLSLEPTQLDYNLFPIGTTSPVQYVQLFNPGNSPITITSYSTGASDFAVTNYNCGTLPFVISPNASCYLQVTFTPTATGNRTGTLTISSSAGNKTVALLGTGEAASQAIAFTPTSPMNSGSVVKGQTSGAGGSSDGQSGDLVSIRNTGTSSVTFSANPTVTGTNAGDFVLYNPYSCGTTGTPLAGNSSCPMWIRFTPSITGAETATLSFTDSAPGSPQTLTLNGTGIAAAPAYSLSNNLLNFDNTVQGATSALNTYIYFYNNSGASVTLGNIVITGDFLIPAGEQTCNGSTIPNGSSCYAYVEFSPTAAGNRTGTITFKNSGGTTLASAPLNGYAPAPVLTALLDPTTLNFAALQVIGTSSSYQSATLTNNGNLPITIGTITGTNLGSSPTNEFSINSNGGSNGCTPALVINPGGTCTVYPVFTPNAAGPATGTLVIPVTYTGGSTGSFTLNLTGTGVAEKNSAVLSPSAGSFVDQTVGVTTSYSVQLTLTNSGNQPFTVGTVSGTNLGAPPANDFSDSAAQGGTDQCTSAVVQPGSSCSVYVRFTPAAAGVRSGTVVFPVTFKDGTTASPTATLSGTGIGAGKTLQVTPTGIQFQNQVVGTTSVQQYVAVKNIGNASVTFTAKALTGDFVLGPNGDGCSGTVLATGSTCYIYISFAPTATGTRTGTLTINDNATGAPQVVNLSGTGIAANQQIALSQSTLTFGNQPQSSTSTPQSVYVTNQGDTTVTLIVGALAGTNPGDYTVNNNCPASLGARATCTISFTFAPVANASGTLTASLPITTSVTGETSLTINLTGTAVAAGPAVALNPSPLTFPLQNVGTTSAVEKFTVTNTGSANLTITSVVSTNPTEFAIPADGCSGATLTPGQNCPVSVTFSPILGGTRSGTIKITDNATGSPQSLTVTGIGYGIPALTPTPTSLTFTNQNIGTTSAAQSVTLSNPGTDTLHFSAITITGVNAGDFALTASTCGATLAPAGSCSVSVKFTPTASGSRGASITITDNANNAPGSTQTVSLTGTGVAVPTAGVAPTALTFTNTNIGSTSAAQTATLTNSGTGPLTIASIAIGGANAGDYAETNNCGASLVAGTSCTISVTFTPTASGTRTASVTITDNANNVSGSTQTVSLTGTGVGVPAAALSPNVVAFTDTNVGVSSSAQTVTLSNSGTAALTIASIAFTGANPGDFSQTNTCAGSVAAGGNCTISVTFKPTAPGNRSATLTVTDNANNVTGSTQTAAVSGTGIGVPVAGVSPSNLTFASTSIGVTTAAQTVTVTNTGTGPLTITQIVIGAANAGDFAQTNNCGSTLAVSGSCTISVTFTPTAAGTRTASLHVVDNSNNVGSTQTVSLSGTGVAVPVAGVAPTSLTFASQNIGTTSPAQSVTLSNTGTGPLAIASVGFTGTNASEFGQTNNCGTSLPASTSCTISVTFSPTAVGSASATLTVTDNSGNVTGATQNVTLTGTGASGGAPTVVSLTPTSGTGLTKTFTAVYSDPNGISDFNSVIILFNTSVSFANGCAVLYVPGTNTMYLYNNAGTALLSTGVTPGSSGSVSNSQCTVNGTGSSFSTSGNNLTLNAALTFAGTFVGNKNVYLYAKGSAGNTGFVMKGTWLPASAGAPTATSVTPSSGTGLTQTFSAVYTDPNGASDLQEVIVLFNTAVSLANACAVVYAPATNTMYLYNNAGTALTAGVVPGSSGSVSNSQCTLFGTGSSVTSSATTLTLNAAVTFTGTFTGLKQIFLYGAGQAANTGWQDKGSWTP